MNNKEAISHLKLCKDYCVVPNPEAIDLAIKALENEPHCNQDNCILTMFGECSYNETGCSDCKIIQKIGKALENKPKKGEWKYTTHYGRRYRVCPFCTTEREDDHSTGWNFCCYCGADLRGEVK